MLVFLDFEASSLAPDSYPIEVGWVFEDGRCEDHLIRPHAAWRDWAPDAQDLHQISRERLAREGCPASDVARRVLAALGGHAVRSGSAVWDGKWLRCLLGAAGLPLHGVQIADAGAASAQAARVILRTLLPEQDLIEAVGGLITLARMRSRGAAQKHRALADACEERRIYLAVQQAAQAMAEAIRARRAGAPVRLAQPRRTEPAC